ncbi:ATP-dependent helicase [uncultured Clostridium sp.]|uniref:ATP-dependent helicase n=1 Tax=uncultured Clostridium sp. TaxID=59620 RepID=UPI00261F09FC|nr:ATP-dependent helicase [uncultured Clostridium sp.]
MNLDSNQELAVKGMEKNILVVAAPGSGKTTVIINKINFLTEQLKVLNKNIIVITFTKAAALNMKKRYINRFKTKGAPFFGTFHGLFYKMLLREGVKINIVEEYKTNRIIQAILKKYSDEVNDDKIKEIKNNISIFKTSREDINSFNPSVTKNIFIECLEAYEIFKKENNLLDFDDLAIKALELLENNRELLSGYRGLFKYILVDEFQDCDKLQIEFLKLMNEGEENKLFTVGDEDQCIYSFRGSKPEYMVIFDRIFKGGKKYFLETNYRSNKNIVHGARELISHNKSRNIKNMNSFKEKDGEIQCLFPADEKEQGDIVVRKIKENVWNKDYRFDQNIILYRTNAEVMSFIDALTRSRIPFNILDKEFNFYDHFICKDIIAYLTLALDIRSKENFLRVINKPFRYVSKANIEYIKNYKGDLNPFDALINKTDIHAFQKSKLEDLKKDINYLSKISLGSAIQFIISDLDYIDYLQEYAKKFGQSIDDLEEILEELKILASDFNNILGFFSHIEEVKEEIKNSKDDKDEDRVLLSTIHRVKGMEFENVFLVNCIEESMPHSSAKEEGIEEERRIFYVGMTRAIENLTILSPRTRGGKMRETSRFLKETNFQIKEMENKGFKVGARVIHKGRGEKGIIRKLDGDRITILLMDSGEKTFKLSILLEKNLLSLEN